MRSIRKTVMLLLAAVLIFAGTGTGPGRQVSAAEKPGFTVRYDSAAANPGDRVRVQLYLEEGGDIVSFAGNVTWDSNIYSLDKDSIVYGDTAGAAELPLVEPNDDGSISVMLSFAQPWNDGGRAVSFDLIVNEGEKGNGSIGFEFKGAQSGTDSESPQTIEAGNENAAVTVKDTIANENEEEAGQETEQGGVALASISLDKNELTLKKGGSQKLKVIYAPENTTADKTVKWSSADAGIASVAQDGTVTGKGEGTTVVTAKVGTLTASCVVAVKGNTEKAAGAADRTAADSVKTGDTGAGMLTVLAALLCLSAVSAAAAVIYRKKHGARR